MDDHLNRNPSRRHHIPPPAQEHPSTSSVRIFLVGDLSSAGNAFYQVFSTVGSGISLIPFDGKDATQALAAIAKEFPQPSPALMVTASPAAWAALRVLNVWHLDTSVFQPATANQSLQIPATIPLPHIQCDTLFDLFAANATSNAGWVARTLDMLARATGRVLDPEDVQRAILHYVAADERHGLHLASKATTHGRNDAIAAIRIIQGAALDQCLTPEAGKKSCQEVSSIGGYFTSPHDWNTLPFFQLVSRLEPASLPKRPIFASILVADDEGFWTKPMEPIWNTLGLALVPQPHPTKVLESIRALEAGDAPVRAVLLDMELHGDSLGGARLLQVLHQRFPHLPIIALSVDDQFSETVLLKRMGAFAYVNKHALAEPHPGRDALSAFRQIKEAVALAGFASLSAELISLADALADANARMIEKQKASRLARHKQEAKKAKEAEKLLTLLARQVRESLFVYGEECRRIFHGYWQDSAYPCGTACRQIIRALGLINDQWSSLWGAWRFDPDGYYRRGRYCRKPCLEAWLQLGDLRFPYWPYHEITTAIRNASSHAMITDSDFTWTDVWIGFLSLFLKMEGTCRRSCGVSLPSHAPQLALTCDHILARLVRALYGLLALSTDDHLAATLSPDLMSQTGFQVPNPLAQVATEVQLHLRRSPRHKTPLKEGDPAWLSLEPYHLAFRTKREPMRGFLKKSGTGLNLSPSQSSAAVLLLQLISRRLAQTADRIHRA
jgi:DNA-binding NarL/FixJ family response regulator